MISTSSKANPNYLAKVIRLSNIRKHCNADRLQVVTIDGNNVITGMNAQEGMIYIYFPLESSINKDYLSFSNSFEEAELNRDKDAKGYFQKTGRVRATRLRNERSEGYMVPAADISHWLKEAYGHDFFFSDDHIDREFDTVCGIKLCEKYVNYEQLRKLKKEQKKEKGKERAKRFNRILEDQFRFHIDTLQLKKFAHQIDADEDVWITKKLHGTSVVLSRVLCNRKLSLPEKVAKWLGIPVKETQYDLLYSSRKVVKNGFLDSKDNENNHYYSTDVWGDCAKKYGEFLKDGITLYGEIVGFTKDGSPIQKGYDYGCGPNEFDLYVYRGTITSDRGDVYEMSVSQLKRYCDKYDIKVVPELFYGTPREFLSEKFDIPVCDICLNDYPSELLTNLIDTYLEKDCSMCRNKVPDEGICLRLDKPFDIEVYKLKSFKFFEYETKMLDQGVIDMETEESSEEVSTND